MSDIKRVPQDLVPDVYEAVMLRYRDSGLNDVQFGKMIAKELGMSFDVPASTIVKARDKYHIDSNFERGSVKRQDDLFKTVIAPFARQMEVYTFQNVLEELFKVTMGREEKQKQLDALKATGLFKKASND